MNSQDKTIAASFAAPDASEALLRIAAALERLAPPAPVVPDFGAADAFIWQRDKATLHPVAKVNRVDIELLRGIDQVRDILVENTERFAAGLAANNALLWGARGMGKSSLVKAVHATVNAETKGGLALVEIHREEVASLPTLLTVLRGQARRTLILVDDLSFDGEDTTYKS